jgi:putative aminopeptidase FrvX
MFEATMQHPAMRLFCELLAVPSPSGRETALAQIVRSKLISWGYQPETDGSGNVFVRLEGSRPTAGLVCFAAHMDEIGAVVTRIEADGTLRLDASGGLRPWKLGEAPVTILGDGEPLVGVISMGSGHGAGANGPASWADLKLLTGLTADQLKEKGVRPGATVVPVREGRGPVVFGDPADPLVGAWTFDDRMGVVALLRLLEALKTRSLQPIHPTVIAFTVNEEIGGEGAKLLAQRLRPEIFISVDGGPIPPNAPVALDGRPGIWSKDRLTHYDQRLVRDLMAAARAAGTELQPVVYDAAASDASMVYAAGGTARPACFGHVRESSHGYEVARFSVFDRVLATLIQFVTTWKADVD